MARHYTISVKTQIPDLRSQCDFARKIKVNGDDTWAKVLSEENLLPVDKHRHFIKSANGKVIAKLDDKVDEFMRHFKTVRQNYIVHLANRAKTRKYPESQCGRKERPKRPTLALLGESKRKKLKKKKPHASPNRSLLKPGGYEEDNMEIPGFNNKHQFAAMNNFGVPGPAHRSNEATYDDDPYDDVMSQDSQYSQDLDEDIKVKIIDKMLKQVTNGDMYRIRQELSKLKESGKFVKASRYIPFTLNVLGHIFE